MAAPNQTPKELLQELKEAHRRYSSPRSKSDLVNLEPFLAFQQRLGRDRKEVEKIIDESLKQERDLGQELFKAILEELPDELGDLFTDDTVFAVGTLDEIEVNAQAMRSANGGWLIVLNRGLYTFLYKIARALATRFVAQDEKGDRPFGEILPQFEETCRWIAEVFAWYKGALIPFGPDFPIHPAQLIMANRLATNAEKFVICHELAHHIMGHTNGGNYKNILLSGVPVEASEWNWQQEHEADEVGLNLLLRGSQNDSKEAIIRYAGADFFLQVMSLYEELAELPISTTHPRSIDRLEHLRKSVDKYCSDPESTVALLNMALTIEQVFRTVRTTLLEPTIEQRRSTEQQSKDTADKLEQLLDECSGSFVPDYMTFYDEASQLLQAGPTNVVASSIGTRLRDYNRILELADPSGSIEGDRITFHKMKLLVGFVERLPQEIKAVIYE